MSGAAGTSSRFRSFFVLGRIREIPQATEPRDSRGTPTANGDDTAANRFAVFGSSFLRYLNHPPSNSWEDLEAPVLVVGGGVAGLSAAIEMAEAHQVLVATKAWLSDSNTDAAQGGVAAVLSPEDSLESHFEDTLGTGCGISNESVVRRVVQEAPDAIRRVMEWGGQFDRTLTGELALSLEGGHSAGRVVHALGDQTGREIQRVLVDRARTSPKLRIMEHAFVLDLVVNDGQAVGAILFSSGRFYRVHARAVIVAAGGCGHVFRETTNREVATGDGHAMMYRAGARLRGMEFMQFHPTTLYIAGAARMLISEAARGEGAILRDCHGHAFMDDLHASGSLAPRDFVSRAVLDRMVQTGHTNVYLDLRHLSPSFVRERFPRINRVCRTFQLDITKDLIPVAPAAHYMIGGASVDPDGRTSVPGLYAVGEAACTGLHGANRLASNSLLEGLVLGHCLSRTLRESLPVATSGSWEQPKPRRKLREEPNFDATDLLNSVQSLMWRQGGLLRNGAELAEASRRLEGWLLSASAIEQRSTAGWELLNLLQVSQLITHAARERTETRGVHCRTDFPDRDDRRWLVELELVCGAAGDIESHRIPVGPGAGSPRRQRSKKPRTSVEGTS